MTIYKRFRRDIWGYSFTDTKCEVAYKNEGKVDRYGRKLRPYLIRLSNLHLVKSSYLKFFFMLWWRKRKMRRKRQGRYVYKFDAPAPYRKWLKFNKRFVSLRLTRLYFITLQDHQFRKVFRSAAKQDGNFEVNYLRFLEGRIVSIIYRLNLSADIFWLIKFMKEGCFSVEYNSITFPNYIVPIGKLLTVSKSWHAKFIMTLSKRIKLRTLLFPTPAFIYACYRMFWFYLLRYPRRRDLIYPFPLDLQRITGYY